MRSVTTHVITDSGALEAMREDWNALLEDSGSWTPFLTWEWVWAWWSHVQEGAVLNVIAVRSGGLLIGLAPLMVVRPAVMTPARLAFIGSGSGADYLDVIVRHGHEDAAAAALAGALASQQVTLHLDNLPPGPVAARLQRELTAAGWSAIESSPDVCPFIHLSGHTWESYLASLGSSHRANVRRRTRALDAAFAVRFSPIDTQDDRRDVLDALFKFHDQRWNGGSTAFSSARLRAFHHAVTKAALDRGWLRMYALTLDGRLAGAMYGFANHGRFYFFQHGCDAAYKGLSIGVVLMALTIRAAIDDGLREFDMLYGHESYKKLWASQHRALGRLMVFPPRLSGRWLQRAAEARRALRALVHRVGWKGIHDAA